MEGIRFLEIKNPATIGEYFKLYPKDWQDALESLWPEHASSSGCYVLIFEEQPVCLGIVFHGYPPEMEAFRAEADAFVRSGALYIGYIYTVPEFRGRGFASVWLNKLLDHFRARQLWLTVEEESLLPFYLKNEFELFTKSPVAEEWLLVSSTLKAK